MTINGDTYVGNPPALTLFQRDTVSFVTVIIVLGAGLLAATVDLVMRYLQHSTRAGTLAIVAGGAVVLVSLFGSLVGLAAGVGVVGLSNRSFRDWRLVTHARTTAKPPTRLVVHNGPAARILKLLSSPVSDPPLGERVNQLRISPCE